MPLTKDQIKAKIAELEDEAWELLFIDCIDNFYEQICVLETLKQEVDCWIQYYKGILKEIEQGEK